MHRPSFIHAFAAPGRLPIIMRALLALLLLNLAACSTLRPVDVGAAMRQGAPAGVFEGSLVEVKTLGGERLKFRVSEVTDRGLRGEPGFIAYENMRQLKVEDPDRFQDVGVWIGGLLGVAALVFLIANADSVSACSGDCPQPEPRP